MSGSAYNPSNMPSAHDYITINKKAWNDRVATHVNSAFYDKMGSRIPMLYSILAVKKNPDERADI